MVRAIFYPNRARNASIFLSRQKRQIIQGNRLRMRANRAAAAVTRVGRRRQKIYVFGRSKCGTSTKLRLLGRGLQLLQQHGAPIYGYCPFRFAVHFRSR
jgi:hypothetical protein